MDLKIPYGVVDFKTIRNEGLYYLDQKFDLYLTTALDLLMEANEERA